MISMVLHYYATRLAAVADLGEGAGGAGPPLFWVEKEEMTEVKKASRASKSRPSPPPATPFCDKLSLDQSTRKSQSSALTSL